MYQNTKLVAMDMKARLEEVLEWRKKGVEDETRL